jgi:hypothetical protein
MQHKQLRSFKELKPIHLPTMNLMNSLKTHLRLEEAVNSLANNRDLPTGKTASLLLIDLFRIETRYQYLAVGVLALQITSFTQGHQFKASKETTPLSLVEVVTQPQVAWEVELVSLAYPIRTKAIDQVPQGQLEFQEPGSEVQEQLLAIAPMQAPITTIRVVLQELVRTHHNKIQIIR